MPAVDAVPGRLRGGACFSPSVRLEGMTVERCWWCGDSPDYRDYHDREWGFPVDDDVRLFEKLSLEGFQSGLSWLTILRKRENFRRAFRGFDFDEVARFTRRDVTRLLKDPGIVRHRGKIEAVVHNAERARELRAEAGSIAAFVWRFEPEPRSRPRRMTRRTLEKLAKTPESQALSRELKKRGWTYVGPTTLYAFMQAMGIVNDHLETCSFRERAEKARKRFRVPRTAARR